MSDNKKKLAVVFRGPCRPSGEFVINNINNIKKSIENYGEVSFDTFLISWSNSNYGKELKEIINSDLLDNVLYFKDVDVNYIRNDLFRARQNLDGNANPKTPENAFRMFWTMKIISDVIASHFNKYDFVFMTRTDSMFNVTDWSDWLVDGAYTMPDIKKTCPEHVKEWFWDQQGCAPPSIMKDVWDYKNFKLLNEAYIFKGKSPYNGTELYFRDEGTESTLLSLLELKELKINLRGSMCFDNNTLAAHRKSKETKDS